MKQRKTTVDTRQSSRVRERQRAVARTMALDVLDLLLLRPAEYVKLVVPRALQPLGERQHA